MEKPLFYIGTVERPSDPDSHGHAKGRWQGKWSVNCVNMWAATLGKELTLESAIEEHLIIVLHEITHAFSEVEAPHNWDSFLRKVLSK